MPMRWAMRFLVASLFFAAAAMAMAQAAPGALFFGTENFKHSDIIDARAQPDVDGQISILVTLEAPAAARLAVLTREYVGKALPLIYRGNEIAAPFVNQPIEGGTFQISGSFSLEEAKQMALDISGKPPLPESLEE